MAESPIFEKVKVNTPNFSLFDLSQDNKFTCDMGLLIPSFISEVLPGDEFKMSTNHLIKFMPMLAPVMHKIDVYFHNFFVPNRLLNSHFEDFITGGENGDYATPLPYINYGEIANEHPEFLYNGTLADYLGLPTFGTDSTSTAAAKVATMKNNTTPINLAPFFAYNLIWQEYYRDQNLESKVLDKSNMNYYNATGHFTDILNPNKYPHFFELRRRAWSKDYFTSALPWAQKGNPVSFTLNGRLPVEYRESQIGEQGHIVPQGALVPFSSPTHQLYSETDSNDNFVGTMYAAPRSGDTPIYTNYDPGDTLSVNFSDFPVTTINELRFAFRAQEFLEKSARGGSRYIEHILIHFGVLSSDKRLQRPEYLGGSKSTIQIAENLQTSATAIDTDFVSPLGNQSGQAYGTDSAFQFKEHFEEHGFIIQIMSILPKASYSNGLSRMWTRMDKLDYAFPEFGNIGEQEILRQELNYLPVSSVNPQTGEQRNLETFGYTPRYAEYKFKPDEVHGEFKNTLQQWHLGRFFDNTNPVFLNANFIHCTPRTNIFAVENVEEAGVCSHHILCEVYHDITAKRKLPFYGTPTF